MPGGYKPPILLLSIVSDPDKIRRGDVSGVGVDHVFTEQERVNGERLFERRRPVALPAAAAGQWWAERRCEYLLLDLLITTDYDC